MSGNTGSKGGENVEEYFCKTKIISGSTEDVLPTLGSQRLMLVTDPYFEKNGVAGKIAGASGAGETAVYSEVVPDPTVEQAAKGAARVKAFSPDTVVALGGGSAMDCAKAMVYFAGLPVRFVAIPTTSGSGSEVTDFAVLTHEGIKHPLIDQTLQPDVAILDEELLKNLPKSLIADTGFDVISHAVESFVATGGGAITRALASDAFAVAVALLPRSWQGDLMVRGQMHTASCMAGLAFNRSGLGLCHAMAHTLGAILHIPHGRLNAILLPKVIEVNSKVAADRYGVLARRAGFSGSSDTLAVRNLKNSLVALRKSLMLPDTLAKAGADMQLLSASRQTILQKTLEDPCCNTNPAPVTAEMVAWVLKEVAGTG